MDKKVDDWQEGPVVSSEAVGVTETVPVRPWGFWATVGFSAIMGVVYLVLSVLISVAFVFAFKASHPQLGYDEIGETLQRNGLLMAVSATLFTLPVVGMCVLFAWCRKGMRVRDYLAIRMASGRQLMVWLGALVGFIIVSDSLTVVIGGPIVPEWMLAVYETSVFPPLLFFAIIVCAPVTEEILFRGFLFKGLKYSWMGPIGATVTTSLLWALLHVQYDWQGIASIFIAGLLLGAARIRTRSVLVPMIMHAVMNIVASVQLLIVLLS